MRSRVARQVTRVHANPTVNSHKVRHRRTAKRRPGRALVAIHADIGLHHIPRPVHVVTVEV